MSLHRKRDGTYEARYYRDGTKQSPHVRENFGSVEPDEARELYKTRLAEASKRKLRRRHLITFRQAAARYLETKRERISAKGYARTKSIIEKLLMEKFGDRRLTEIMPAEIESFMAGRVKAGKSKATANREWTAMNAVLRFASKKLGADVPAIGRVEMFKLPNRGAKTAFIEPEEWRALIAAFFDEEAFVDFIRDRRRLGKERKEAFLESLRAELPKIEVLLYTGQRLGDVLNLECEDVHLRRGEILWRPAKTGEKPLVIPIGERLRAVLEPRVKGRTGKVWGHGNSPAAQRRVQRALHIACEMAGTRRITPHMLRKTFGSWLARDGASLRIIQELLGHADPTITARHYAYLSPSALLSAVARVEAIAFEEAGKVADDAEQPQMAAKQSADQRRTKLPKGDETQRVNE